MTLLLSLTRDEAEQLFAEEGGSPADHARPSSPPARNRASGTAPVPLPPEEQVWSLEPPEFKVFGCRRCGASMLRAGACCGEATGRVAAPYYLPVTSAGIGGAPEFSVVMLVKNRLELTRVAVESLLRARGEHSVEFVFVDCCSTDGSLNYFQDLARSEPVKLIVTHPEEPFVYSRNCNRGAEAARAPFLLFANNDIEVCDPHLFDKLARALKDERVGVVGTLTDSECSNDVQSRRSLLAERVWTAQPVVGFLWGVRAEVFGVVGGLDEDFRGYGCDEIDFEYRTIQHNYRLAVVDSMVHHEGSATFGPDVRSSLIRSIRQINDKHGFRLYEGGVWYGPFLRHRYPKVSVAIACRNYARFLPRALESVVSNALPPDARLQVVLVNDASTDDTALVAEQYRREHASLLNVIHRRVSHGPAAAKNAALRRCIGDYVALLDADDEFLPQKLSRSLESITAEEADFLYHDFEVVLPSGRHEERMIGQWSIDRWRAGTSLPTNVWVFRNGCVRFNEGYVTAEDPNFLLRSLERLKVAYLPEMLSRYHLHAGSLSSRPMCAVVDGQLRGLREATVWTQ